MGDGAAPGGVRGGCDVLVIGGGVCGLWTLHALRAAGYDAWLIEKSALGDGQTIASQGILHAGAKYQLPGNAVDAAQAVADVQEVWAAAMSGGLADGSVPDLGGVSVIDGRTLLWTTAGIGSRVAAQGAKRIMRSAVHRLPRGEWPAGFAAAPKGVEVYETQEMVLEPGSLLARLAAGALVEGRVRRGEVLGIEARADGCVVRVCAGDGAEAECAAGAVVLAAGGGNAALLDLAGGDGEVLMQRRPLHQLVALDAPFALNGHCLQLSVDRPALTVTTGEIDGRRSWYFGGGPAEEGVGRSAADQIAAGRAAVAKCLPWVDQSGLAWRVFEIDRAEGRTAGGKRPSESVAVWGGERVLAVWPTKLVLAPRAAGLVLARLAERGVVPGAGADFGDWMDALGPVGVAARVW